MMPPSATPAGAPPLDLLIVGGGINGAGIARDAAGRGLAVALCEQGDFAGGTSSASTQLIHGGLRYLEHREFRLVAESLAERETLGRIAAHLVRPLRFVLPHTPGLRPAWQLRAGLWLYDHLGALYLGRGQKLPASTRIDLRRESCGRLMRPELGKAFVYSDLGVDDARLVIANLRSAADLGARILPRTRLVTARRQAGEWRAKLDDGRRRFELAARVLINAAGPWVMDVVRSTTGDTGAGITLVKGCHLVLPRLYADEHAWLLQNDDGRIVFLIPWRRHFTLLGTTETRVDSLAAAAGVSDAEVDYLLGAVNRYLRQPLAAQQVIHRYWGVRPLFDDGRGDPARVTRDYHLRRDLHDGATAITLFGGKLTTYRRLAETVLAQLPADCRGSAPWTRTAALPGSAGFVSAAACSAELGQRYRWLDSRLLAALVARHGRLAPEVIGTTRSAAGLGRCFGDALSECEIDYLCAREWATEAEDLLWRRSKAGLFMSQHQRDEFRDWFAGRRH